jgi:hypothetical protein
VNLKIAYNCMPALQRGVVVSRGAILGWELFRQLVVATLRSVGIDISDRDSHEMLDYMAQSAEILMSCGLEPDAEQLGHIASDFLVDARIAGHTAQAKGVIGDILRGWVRAVQPAFLFVK